MKIEIIETDKAVKSSSPLSQAIKVGESIYISGQLGKNPETGKMGSSIEEQTHNALINLKYITEEAGSDLDHVVKTTIFLVNLDDAPIVNKVYEKFFTNVKPTRSCIEISRLGGGGGALVEIEAIAVLK